MANGKHRRLKPEDNRQKRRPNRGRSVIRWIGYVVFAVVYVYVSTSLWIFQGPFPALKSYLINSLDATRHAYLLKPLSLYTVSESVIQAHSLTHNLVSDTVPIANIKKEDYSNVTDGTVKHYTYDGKTFHADILLIRDPKRIKVVATKYLGKYGETVQQMVKDAGAVAGINAGGFDDQGWHGTGAYPQGITIHEGKTVSNTGGHSTVVAFTKTGQMIAGAYSLSELHKLGVTEAVSFGPVLVENGKPVPTPGGEGLNPRTAIGQTANGTVILIVTDGRGASGPNDAGASFDDLKALMLKYHAKIAANLDGGSSATMVYHGKLMNKTADILGERKVATSIVVMPEGGQ